MSVWTPKSEAANPRTGTIRRAVTAFLNGLRCRIFQSAPVNDVLSFAAFGTNKMYIRALYPGPAYDNSASLDLVNPANTADLEITVDPDGSVHVTLGYQGVAVTTTYNALKTALNANPDVAKLFIASGGTADLVTDEGPTALDNGVLATAGEEGELAILADGSRMYVCELTNGLISWYEATFTKVS